MRIRHRRQTYRHSDVDEWEVRVDQPSRELDRLFQRLPAPSPIHHWGGLVFRWKCGTALSGRQCLRKSPQEDGHGSVSHDRSTTEDEVTFVVGFVQGYDGRETVDREEV